MEPADLPEDVLGFLMDRIESVPHLEALLLLWQNPEKSWTLNEIATRLYVRSEVAQTLLAGLVRLEMVRVEPGDVTSYRYSPDWDPGGLMARVASTYSRQLVRVAQLIHSKASPGVREFARAFQIKKDRS